MIKDSGARTEFATGAVRDIQDGKGRCDLLPLDVAADCFEIGGEDSDVLGCIGLFQETGAPWNLFVALSKFAERRWGERKTMLLEVAIQFEEGAKKYGENNWRKGIPVQRYINSGVRHYLKWMRGDNDEPHDRAFCWNIMCAIWTCKHKPELNDYAEVPK